MKNFKLILTITVIIAGLVLGNPIRAQGDSQQGGGRGYFMFGGSKIDIENLNSGLENAGYSTFSDRFISFGGGGYGIIKRIIIGGEGHGLIGEEATNESTKTSISGGYGFFDVGYLLYSTDAFNLYPLLGIGGGGVNLKIVERSTPSFEDVLENPNRNAELSTGGFLIDLGFGADYLYKLGEDEGEEGGLALGLRMGYTLTPIKSSWDMDGIDVSDGPDTGVTGPYIRFMIGGGGMNR